MNLKEKIHSSVNQMNMNELILMYEHIRLLHEMRRVSDKKRAVIPIEKILEMTGSSESCWGDSVIKEREQL